MLPFWLRLPFLAAGIIGWWRLTAEFLPRNWTSLTQSCLPSRDRHSEGCRGLQRREPLVRIWDCAEELPVRCTETALTASPPPRFSLCPVLLLSSGVWVPTLCPVNRLPHIFISGAVSRESQSKTLLSFLVLSPAFHILKICCPFSCAIVSSLCLYLFSLLLSFQWYFYKTSWINTYTQSVVFNQKYETYSNTIEYVMNSPTSYWSCENYSS